MSSGRLDAVDGDVLGRQLEGGAADEAVDTRIAGREVRRAGHRDPGPVTDNVTSIRPAAACARMWPRGLCQPEADTSMISRATK